MDMGYATATVDVRFTVTVHMPDASAGMVNNAVGTTVIDVPLAALIHVPHTVAMVDHPIGTTMVHDSVGVAVDNLVRNMVNHPVRIVNHNPLRANHGRGVLDNNTFRRLLDDR
jgi:hypothetical protein